MGVQKIPIQKMYELSVGFDTLMLIFQAQIDNLIGWKYLWYLMKATNTQQSITAITPNQQQNI